MLTNQTTGKITTDDISWHVSPGLAGDQHDLIVGRFNEISFSCLYPTWGMFLKARQWWARRKILFAVNMLHACHWPDQNAGPVFPYYLPYPCEKCYGERVQKHQDGSVVCEVCGWDHRAKKYRISHWAGKKKNGD